MLECIFLLKHEWTKQSAGLADYYLAMNHHQKIVALWSDKEAPFLSLDLLFSMEKLPLSNMSVYVHMTTDMHICYIYVYLYVYMYICICLWLHICL